MTNHTKPTVWFVVLWFSSVSLGMTDFSCDTNNPLIGANVTCKCVTPNNIEWTRNDVAFSSCTTTGLCSPRPSGYGFHIDTSNHSNEYRITIQQYDYDSCAVYSCIDLSTTEEKKETLSIVTFLATISSVLDEPGDHNDGIINITTGCIFDKADLKVEWFSVKGNMTEKYIPPPEDIFQTFDCEDTCNGEAAVRLNIGFTHTEGDSKESVKFRLKIYHANDSDNTLVLETLGEYKITEKKTNDEQTDDTQSDSGTSWWKTLLLVIIGIIVACVITLKCSEDTNPELDVETTYSTHSEYSRPVSENQSRIPDKRLFNILKQIIDMRNQVHPSYERSKPVSGQINTHMTTNRSGPTDFSDYTNKYRESTGCNSKPNHEKAVSAIPGDCQPIKGLPHIVSLHFADTKLSGCNSKVNNENEVTNRGDCHSLKNSASRELPLSVRFAGESTVCTYQARVNNENEVNREPRRNPTYRNTENARKPTMYILSNGEITNR